jgi:hypothetical protein
VDPGSDKPDAAVYNVVVMPLLLRSVKDEHAMETSKRTVLSELGVTMSTESPDVLSILAGLNDKLDALHAELKDLRAERSAVASGASSRTTYSTKEVAVMVDRNEFTVRQWCLGGRIKAHKRGRSGQWGVSASEVTRYLEEGFLPKQGRP